MLVVKWQRKDQSSHYIPNRVYEFELKDNISLLIKLNLADPIPEFMFVFLIFTNVSKRNFKFHSVPFDLCCQILDRKWHKFHFGVRLNKVVFYLDCGLIGEKEIFMLRRPLDMNGKIHLSKRSGSRKSVPVSKWLQYAKLCHIRKRYKI